MEPEAPASRELEGLDPWDLLDGEAARIDAHLRSLPAERWTAATRCEKWDVRAVLAHLAASEEYHQACVHGEVAGLFTRMAERGATDIEAFNDLGVADRADRSAAELLAEWRTANAQTRRDFRERGDAAIDTSVGDYPNRLQSFHVAGELATHADDIGVPVSDAEREARLAWRARFSRFALREAKPDLEVEGESGTTRVRGGGVDVTVADHELVEAVAGRLPPTSRLSEAERAALSTMP
jgi:uncharacterized protein (TIGR03083 family)